MNDPDYNMASWAQIRDGINQISVQLAEGTTTSADILKNLMPYITAAADAGMRMEAEQMNMGARVLQHQGAIEVLTNKPSKGHAGGMRGILENKSVSSLPMLGSDKLAFRNWNDRLVNIVSNIRPGSRKILKAMMEFVDQEIPGDFYDDWKETQESGEMEQAGTTYMSIDEDLYTLLTDRTEGEAALRVRGCTPGSGCKAYMTIYKWFTGVSGQAIAERMKKICRRPRPRTRET